MGSGHETTNRSVEHMVACCSAISLGCSVLRLLTWHNQEIAQSEEVGHG